MNTQTFETSLRTTSTVSTAAYLLAKRSLDIIAATVGLLLLAPLLLLTMAAVSLTSRGGPLFAQHRVGKDGKHFRCWKIRSMYRDAEARRDALVRANEMAGGVTFKIKNDPRITPVGRVIRKLSIDELPQLYNVLVGDMTLVGPRPSLPQEVAEYTAYQRARLTVTPGITCIWQVSGRSSIAFPEQVEMDLAYIRNRCIALDISLLFKTIPAVLTARGAC